MAGHPHQGPVPGRVGGDVGRAQPVPGIVQAGAPSRQVQVAEEGAAASAAAGVGRGGGRRRQHPLEHVRVVRNVNVQDGLPSR